MNNRHSAPAALIAAALLAPLAHAADPVVVIDERLRLAASGTPGAHEAPRAYADEWQRWADDFSRDMRASMGTMFGHRLHGDKVVKGAPYSAEVITETNQALADGNVISRKKVGAVHRDGAGRTRQETPAEGAERSVFIHDPVSGQHVVIPAGRKHGVVRAPRVLTFTNDNRDVRVVKVGGTEVRIEDGKVLIDGKEARPGRAEVVTRAGKTVVVDNGRILIDGKEVVPGEGATVVRRIDSSRSDDGTQREEIRVQVVRSGDGMVFAAPPAPPTPPTPPVPPTAPAAPTPGAHSRSIAPLPPVPPLPPMPGIEGMRFESTARLGKGVTTDLGARDFDGVKAEGKSTVWTIPAGEIGNRNPINVTSEKWYAPDLKVTVYSRYHDPRTGETLYRLAGIRRGEPPAELFRVPVEPTPRARAPKAP